MRVTRNYLAELRKRSQRAARREVERADRRATGDHAPDEHAGRDALQEVSGATFAGFTVGYHAVGGTADIG